MRTKGLSLSNILILLSVLFAWWLTAVKIEPFLLYHCQQIGFSTRFGFLKSYLTIPGGISNYLADFVSQFFAFNTFGSFLIVAIASLQGLMALNIVKRLMGKVNFSFPVFAVILLLGIMVLCDYRYPYHASIRLFFVFLFTWVFSIVNGKLPRQCFVLWTAMALLLFYFASGAALIIFAISSAVILIYTRQKKTWLIAAPLLILFAGIIPFIGFKFLFPTSLMTLYKVTEIKHPEILAYATFFQLYAYYLILPVVLLTVLLFKPISENRPVASPTKGYDKAKVNIFKKTPFIVTVQLILCVVPGYFMFIKSYDSFKKKILYIEYYAENGQWHEILKVAESIQVYDFRVNFQIARAYAHLGQLPNELFNYPQLLGTKGIIFDSSAMNSSFTMPTSDLYFDLGFMSESVRWAFEAQTLMPNSPRILKRLVMVNLVNRKYELAGKYLKILDQNMLCKNWVDKYEKYVSDTTLAANDKVIAEKRRFTPQKKAINNDPVENMKLLIETNKDNRMAYDYLLTLFILDTNFPEFIKYVQNYRYYNIKTLPSSWAQALSVYIIRIKSIPPFVDDETISKECLDRFKAFNNTMLQFNNDKSAAQTTVKRYFENTYWYYLLYLNPKVTNAFNNKTIIR